MRAREGAGRRGSAPRRRPSRGARRPAAAPEDAAREAPAIRERLLGWYGRARRDLPWRSEPTPYRVWISEVMLQQTRVDVVIPRFLDFIARFPDLRSLAGAAEEEVLAAWSGLGYYSRARSLHAAARAIAERHGGEFPRDPAEARALPGVGPYTTAAVLSIAHGIPLAVLDGNVHRVLSRLFRRGGDPRSGAAARELEEIAAALLPGDRPGDFNQALMELGALVCLPSAPRCGECPLAPSCRARSAGNALRFPERAPGRAPVEVALAAALVERGGLWLLERAGPGAPWLRGLWGFPVAGPPGGGAGAAGAEGARREVARRVEERLGRRVRCGERAGQFRHSITYRRITLAAWRFTLDGAEPAGSGRKDGGDGWGWFPLERLGAELAASSLFLKVRRAVERPGG